MFSRRLLQAIPQTVHFFRKELVLVSLLAFCILSGVIDPQVQSNGSVWEKNKSGEVKGAQSNILSSQFSEVEIVPAKYEKPKVTSQTQKKEWGVARQIDEYTWTMNVDHDGQMATPSETISALNAYRQAKGRSGLQFDQRLSDYAIKRAEFFVGQGNMDSHAGFQDFISNHDGFNVLGFNSLGENSSLGYQLEGTHLIEWVFAGDAPHDNNQLNPEWTHVGVGISGTAVDIVFGGRKR